MRILAAIMLLLAVVCATALLAQEEKGISVDRIVFCTGMEGREPVGENSQFFETAERIFCFTALSGAADTASVYHVWYYGDKEMARVELPVGSSSWRTWSSKKIVDDWAGTWRVDVLSEDGKVLSSLPFVYKPLGE